VQTIAWPKMIVERSRPFNRKDKDSRKLVVTETWRELHFSQRIGITSATEEPRERPFNRVRV